jgi:hypothetical protein
MNENDAFWGKGKVLSDTFNVKLYGPCVVGVPLMVTLGTVLMELLNVSPAGSAPLLMVQL